MTTKLPGLPPVPSNLGPDATAYLKAIGEALEVRLGRRGDPVDRAVTLRELIDSGLATQLGHVPFNPDNLGTTVDFESAVAPDLTQPPAPTGLAATAAFETVLLEWSNGNLQFRNFAFTEIHRATSNVIGNATLVGVVRGNRFADTVDSDTTHYYWVRHVSTSDIRGPFNDTAGTVATTQKLEGADIQPLTITNTLIANNAAIDGAKIADLDAAKITTGTLNANRINVDGATIIANGSGQLEVDELNANQITTGQLNGNNVDVVNLNASNITSGTLTSGRIDVTDLLLPTGGGVISGTTLGGFATNTANQYKYAMPIGVGAGIYSGYIRFVGGTNHIKSVYGFFTTSNTTAPISTGPNTNVIYETPRTDTLAGHIFRFYSSSDSTNIPITFSSTVHTGTVYFWVLGNGDSGPDTFTSVEARFYRFGTGTTFSYGSYGSYQYSIGVPQYYARTGLGNVYYWNGVQKTPIAGGDFGNSILCSDGYQYERGLFQQTSSPLPTYNFYSIRRRTWSQS